MSDISQSVRQASSAMHDPQEHGHAEEDTCDEKPGACCGAWAAALSNQIPGRRDDQNDRDGREDEARVNHHVKRGRVASTLPAAVLSS